MGNGPNDVGSSRHHLIQACEDTLRRLAVHHIDIYHMHAVDALTRIQETSKRSTLSSKAAKSVTSLAPIFAAGTL